MSHQQSRMKNGSIDGVNGNDGNDENDYKNVSDVNDDNGNAGVNENIANSDLRNQSMPAPHASLFPIPSSRGFPRIDEESLLESIQSESVDGSERVSSSNQTGADGGRESNDRDSSSVASSCFIGDIDQSRNSRVSHVSHGSLESHDSQDVQSSQSQQQHEKDESNTIKQTPDTVGRLEEAFATNGADETLTKDKGPRSPQSSSRPMQFVPAPPPPLPPAQFITLTSPPTSSPTSPPTIPPIAPPMPPAAVAQLASEHSWNERLARKASILSRNSRTSRASRSPRASRTSRDSSTTSYSSVNLPHWRTSSRGRDSPNSSRDSRDSSTTNVSNTIHPTNTRKSRLSRDSEGTEFSNFSNLTDQSLLAQSTQMTNQTFPMSSSRMVQEVRQSGQVRQSAHGRQCRQNENLTQSANTNHPSGWNNIRNMMRSRLGGRTEKSLSDSVDSSTCSNPNGNERFSNDQTGRRSGEGNGEGEEAVLVNGASSLVQNNIRLSAREASDAAMAGIGFESADSVASLANIMRNSSFNTVRDSDFSALRDSEFSLQNGSGFGAGTIRGFNRSGRRALLRTSSGGNLRESDNSDSAHARRLSDFDTYRSSRDSSDSQERSQQGSSGSSGNRNSRGTEGTNNTRDSTLTRSTNQSSYSFQSKTPSQSSMESRHGAFRAFGGSYAGESFHTALTSSKPSMNPLHVDQEAEDGNVNIGDSIESNFSNPSNEISSGYPSQNFQSTSNVSLLTFPTRVSSGGNVRFHHSVRDVRANHSTVDAEMIGETINFPHTPDTFHTRPSSSNGGRGTIIIPEAYLVEESVREARRQGRGEASSPGTLNSGRSTESSGASRNIRRFIPTWQSIRRASILPQHVWNRGISFHSGGSRVSGETPVTAGARRYLGLNAAVRSVRAIHVRGHAAQADSPQSPSIVYDAELVPNPSHKKRKVCMALSVLTFLCIIIGLYAGEAISRHTDEQLVEDEDHSSHDHYDYYDAEEDSRVVAYVDNWESCPSDYLVSAYSHIVIAFAATYSWAPNKNVCDEHCQIATLSDVDGGNTIFGRTQSETVDDVGAVPICEYENKQELIHKWRGLGIKVLLGFGGTGMGSSSPGDQNNCWDYCFGKEDQLSTHLVSIVRTQNLDGISINYEYCYDAEGKQKGQCSQRTNIYSDEKAQNFLGELTHQLRTKLDQLQQDLSSNDIESSNDLNNDGDHYVVVHSPKDGDMMPDSIYFQILKDRKDDISFLMPNFYNGFTRPGLDGFDGAREGTISAATIYDALVNDLFDGAPHKVVFGFCISACTDTRSNMGVDETLNLLSDIQSFNGSVFSCHGGVSLWMSSNDFGGQWSHSVEDFVSLNEGCSRLL